MALLRGQWPHDVCCKRSALLAEALHSLADTANQARASVLMTRVLSVLYYPRTAAVVFTLLRRQVHLPRRAGELLRTPN